MSLCKGIPLRNDEVLHLIQLIESESAIFNKDCKSKSNKMKDEAWERITDAFNKSGSSRPRSQSQLRIKWENLKKAARKKMTILKQNNEMGEYSQLFLGKVLNRVVSIIGSECTGFTAEFGGDSESPEDAVLPAITEIPCTDQSSVHAGHYSDDVGESDHKKFIKSHRKLYFKRLSSNRDIHKKQEYEICRARIQRDMAMAEYYKVKTKKIELELKLLREKLNLDE